MGGNDKDVDTVDAKLAALELKRAEKAARRQREREEREAKRRAEKAARRKEREAKKAEFESEKHKHGDAERMQSPEDARREKKKKKRRDKADPMLAKQSSSSSSSSSSSTTTAAAESSSSSSSRKIKKRKSKRSVEKEKEKERVAAEAAGEGGGDGGGGKLEKKKSKRKTLSRKSSKNKVRRRDSAQIAAAAAAEIAEMDERNAAAAAAAAAGENGNGDGEGEIKAGAMRFQKFRLRAKEDVAFGSTGKMIFKRTTTIATSQPSDFFAMVPKKKKRAPMDRIVKDVPLPKDHKLSKALLFDPKSGNIHINKLRAHLEAEGRLDDDCLVHLLERAKAILHHEPPLLQLQGATNVFGDIHGQYYDLLHILDKAAGSAGLAKGQFLFLGDYVDRGIFGTEVVIFLLGLKIRYPKHVFLLRGNHESRQMTEYFNFKFEVYHKYSGEIYEMIMSTFDNLPLAALVESGAGRFFCVHGGISPDLERIEELNDIDRFAEPPDDGVFCDLLWSDPVEEDDMMSIPEMEDFWRIEFMYNEPRGVSYNYGYRAVKNFCAQNKLTAVVRAHQVQQEGYHEHYFLREDEDAPLVITVFSAPNYCDMYENECAYLKITDDDYTFHRFGWKEHPYYLPDYLDCISYSVPYVLDYVTQLFMDVLRVFIEGDDDASLENQEAMMERLENFANLSSIYKNINKQREAATGETLIGAAAKTLEEPDDAFEKAKKKDFKVDMMMPKKVNKRKVLQRKISCHF